MARDYAILNNAQPPLPPHDPAKKPRFRWAVLAVIVALLSYALWHYLHARRAAAVAATPQSTMPQNNSHTNHPATTTTKAPPEFSFYTLLPNMKVDVTELTPPPPVPVHTPPAPTQSVQTGGTATTSPAARRDTTPIANNDQPPALASDTPPATETLNPKDDDPAALQATANQKHYYLQIGSFTVSADAEKLKQRLASEGFPVSVRSAQTPGHQTVNRVWVGPFAQMTQAEQQQRKLQAKSYPSILLSMQKE